MLSTTKGRAKLVSLNIIRYQQQYRQLQTMRQPGVGTVVTYGTRDAITGQRIVQSADGGQQLVNYLSNSAPGAVLATFNDAPIGLAGYASQKTW
ncbi:MAG: hypothetical protein ACRCZS_02320 [Chroococcidiopsis sp.]